MDIRERLKVRRRLRRLGKNTFRPRPQQEEVSARPTYRFRWHEREFMTPWGPTFVREAFYSWRDISRAYQVGDLRSSSLVHLGDLAEPPLHGEPSVESLVFLDTETTGLEQGTGTWVFLVGVGHVEEAGVRLRQYFLRDLHEEPALLAQLVHDLAAADARILITYNGMAFDVPLLQTRYTLHGMASPLADLHHLDLLHYTRKIWRPRLGRVSLSNVERSVLGYEREALDVPGWLVPELYRRYLATGEMEHLMPVFYHNEQDVLSLVVLTFVLAQCWADPWAHPALTPDDMVAHAQLCLERGEVEKAEALLYHAARHARLPHLRHRALVRLSELLKRGQRWQEAVALWEEWAASPPVPDMTPFEELAKHLEWRARRWDQALYWVERALHYVSQLPPSQQERYRAALLRRRERLQKHLQRTSGC